MNTLTRIMFGMGINRRAAEALLASVTEGAPIPRGAVLRALTRRCLVDPLSCQPTEETAQWIRDTVAETIPAPTADQSRPVAALIRERDALLSVLASVVRAVEGPLSPSTHYKRLQQIEKAKHLLGDRS